MAKKRVTASPSKSAPSKSAKKVTRKKAAKKGDLPGQKTMPHGPKKVQELEQAGLEYVEAEASLQARKGTLSACDGRIFDLLKKKRLKSYTVAGKVFSRKPGGEVLSVTKAKT